MDSNEIKAYLAEEPPRMPNQDVQKRILNLIIPRSARIILTIMPIMMIIMLAVLLGIVLPKLRLKASYRLAVEKTSLNEGSVRRVAVKRGGKGSVTYTYEFEFPLVNKNGTTQVIKGYCFSGGKLYREGDKCTVKYIPEQPQICCIENCRMNPISLWMFPIMIVVIIASLLTPFIVIGLRKGWVLRILENGELAEGKIVRVRRGSKGMVFVDVEFSHDEYNYKGRVMPVALKVIYEFAEKTKAENKTVTVLFLKGKNKKVFLLDYLEVI